jgi:DNA-directed RNA polymerase subunit RPC12/RpoP
MGDLWLCLDCGHEWNPELIPLAQCPECGSWRINRGHRLPRVCRSCDRPLPNPAQGPDSCWGVLPGVKSACCGHGTRKGYILFENDVKVEGRFTVSTRTSLGTPSVPQIQPGRG